MKERNTYAVSGSHGFAGTELLVRLGEDAHGIGRNSEYKDYIDDNFVIDLAAFGNLAHQKGDVEIYKTNVSRLHLMLNNATQMDDLKGFVVTSSSAVALPTETFYTESKKAAEGLARLYARDHGLPVVIVRPFSITGLGEQKEHLIPKLIDSCINGNEMPFVAEPVHDYVDVQDFVSGLIAVANAAREHKGEVFEIGSGYEYSNKQVLDIVEDMTGMKANIVPVASMRSYDTDHWKADLTQMRKLGWQPRKTLTDSIYEMVKGGVF